MTAPTTAPNRLVNETSPYLLQHAHNPVDWYPWGDEAFAKAKAEDKPVFLSVGYSTCHWCHVMARESFDSRDVADVLNEYFISVKVDKEERPDIDSIYMSVCQMLTGSGGWPLTVIMTPEQIPFYAATYLPKYSRGGLPGLIDLLLSVSDQWEEDRNSLLSSGGRIVAALNHKAAIRSPGNPEKLTSDALEMLKRQYDAKYGGFGQAPKFPMPHNLLFLMTAYERTGDIDALRMAEQTLTHMYRGGIFDHIGGGFSRYSTDRFWLAPHFEKMLYDNAMLTLAYVKAFELTGDETHRFTAERTLQYLERELSHIGGGFYSAQDADSDGVEGKYYVFTPGEINNLLGERDGARFCVYYGITEDGNFEGKSIPNRIGRSLEFDISSLTSKVEEYRKKRCVLGTDDKILTAWNGLAVAAFSRAYDVFGDARYLHSARSAVDFIKQNMWDGERLYASYRDGKRTKDGYLDDYAFLTYGLLTLFGAAKEREHLDFAHTLTEQAISSFWDAENGGFYLYSSQGEQLISRPKETYDGAVPSGNSVMLYNLKELGFKEHAGKQLEYMTSCANAYPSGFCFALMSFYHNRPNLRCENGVCTAVHPT